MNCSCEVRSPSLPSSLTHLLFSILSCLCTCANIASPLLVRDQGYVPSAHPCPARSFTPKAESAPPSILLLEPSPLRHVIAIHLIRISATSLTSSITITATCALSLDPRRTSEIASSLSLFRRGFVLETAFCMGDALVQYLSRSIQYNWLVLGTSISPPLPFLRLPSSSLTLRQPLAPSIDKHPTRCSLLLVHLNVRHTLPLLPFSNTPHPY
jgi:hypothetical protein